VKDYVDGAVEQLLERTRQLCELIPRGLRRDVSALEVSCRDRLSAVGRHLKALRDDAVLCRPENQMERLRLLRRVRGELDHIESVAVTVMCRWNDEDSWINALTDALAREIHYPLPTPVVSCSSQRYYHTYPDLRLICVPLAEGRFLLHLPDLYHELGHSLLAFENDGRLLGFQRKLLDAVNGAQRYVASELRKENSGLGPSAFREYLAIWMWNWPSWCMELFCDLFAVYTVGAAFAWAHLHLSASAGGDPFRFSPTQTTVHPPDAVRMAIILIALGRLGLLEEQQAIGHRWNTLVDILSCEQSPEYRRCFPSSLLEGIETSAYEGMCSLGCELAAPNMQGPGRRLLNDAWVTFWRGPSTYIEWERSAVTRLASLMATPEANRAASSG